MINIFEWNKAFRDLIKVVKSPSIENTIVLRERIEKTPKLKKKLKEIWNSNNY